MVLLPKSRQVMNKSKHGVRLDFVNPLVRLNASILKFTSTFPKRDSAFGASSGPEQYVRIEHLRIFASFNLHPLSTPVSYPASLQQSHAT